MRRALSLLLLSTLVAAAPRGNTWLFVIGGVGGDDEHRQSFVDAALAFIDGATTGYGVAPERVKYLAERVDLAPDRAHARSTREEIARTFADLAAAMEANDQVLVLLIGHGSDQGGRARLNIPGPDVGPGDFATWLDLLGNRPVGFVNTTSSSGAFVAPLSAPGRTIVTATRGGRQRDEPKFLEHFVRAFTDGAADVDKDDGVSLLEAFTFATLEVQRAYEAEGLIRTEHALLDDNGDGEGSEEPTLEGADGRIAHSFVVGAAGANVADLLAREDPELRRLLQERAELTASLADLRLLRESLAEDEYLTRLEDLVVRIAEIDTEIRSREGTR